MPNHAWQRTGTRKWQRAVIMPALAKQARVPAPLGLEQGRRERGPHLAIWRAAFTGRRRRGAALAMSLLEGKSFEL